MAEVSVTERTRQHGVRLSRIRERTGISVGRLMDALGFKTDQAYLLYEKGTSVIRLDRLEDWAEAFDLDAMDFTAILLGRRSIDDVLGEAEPAWHMADALKGRIPEADIPGYVRANEHKPLADQQSAARGIIRNADRRRAKSRTGRNRPA